MKYYFPKSKGMFVLLVLITSLSGCVSTPIKIELPEWVKNPPLDTSSEMYGIGSGFNIESAKSQALQDVSAKFGLSLKGTIEINEQSNGIQYSKYLGNKVNISQEEIKISQYQLIKNTVINNQVYALLKVNKVDVLNDNKQALEKLNLSAENRLSKKSKESLFLWHYRSQELIKSDFEKAIRYSAIVHMLDNSSKLDELVYPWAVLGNSVSESSSKICLKIESKNKNLAAYNDAVETYLIKQNVNVSPKCQDTLKLSSVVKESKLFDHFVHSETLTIKLVTKKEGSIASSNLNLTGKSLSNFTNAKDGSVAKFKLLLEESSLWQLIKL